MSEPGSEPDPWVARLHLRSTQENVDHRAIESWCIGEGGEGWAGVGWGLWWGEEHSGIAWERYAESVDGGVNDSVQLLHDLPQRSLIWTRKGDGTYWLGEARGPWEYRDGDDAAALDMFNLRPCYWWHVGIEDAVPGVIVNNFRASKTLNPVVNQTAVRYTRRLHAQLSGLADETESIGAREVIEALIGAGDLEDLVAVYLQDQHGLLLVSRRRSTVGYEYVLRDRHTGRRAVATVKSGGAAVDLDALPHDREVEIWAYAVAERHAVGAPRDDVRWIETQDLVEFVESRPEVLPDQLQRWLS